jgi:ATP-dependent helicase/nuclease subunit A
MSVSKIIGKDYMDTLFGDKPRFLAEKGLTGAEKGTAFHNFMKYANYESAKVSLTEEIKRLVEEKFITKAQADSINPDSVEKFLGSDLFKRMMDAKWFEREYEFLVVLGEEDTPLIKGTGKEKISVQGVADVVFEENDELVIVDYKTDRITNVNTLAERYSSQLNLYSLSIEKVMGKKVKEMILYSVLLGEWIVL